jgi:hypothetical protein
MRWMGVVSAIVAAVSSGAVAASSKRAPADAKAVWLDPTTADEQERDIKEGGDPFFFERPFVLTQQHISLLRKARFMWDTVEVGAPILDSEKPYGQPALMTQLATAFGKAPSRQLAMRHVEAVASLRTLLQHGRLEPGVYTIRNLTREEAARRVRAIRTQLSLPPNAGGLHSDGRFELTADHLKLLKVMSPQWSTDTAESALDVGAWPVAGIDPKRPYGDMSFFVLDMVRALGGEVVVDADGRGVAPPEPEYRRLMALHADMLGAIQVFVENARIDPGVYP